MEKTTFSDGEVADYVNKEFVNINLDAGRAQKEAERFKIEAIPATFLVTSKGDIVAKQIGYVSPKKYVSWLKGCVEADKELKSLLPKLEERKDDPLFHKNLGIQYEKLGLEDRAIGFFKRALSSAEAASDKQVQADVLVRLMEVYSKSEEHVKELDDVLSKARTLDSEGKFNALDDVLMFDTLAALNKGDMKKASEIADKAVQRFPKSDRMDAFLTFQGFLLWKLKDDKEGAVKLLKQVVEKYPDSDYAPAADHLIKDVTGEHKH
jgi:tetratricopeptide (TPR) repeat protein